MLLNSYKLTFGNNKDLEITENVKVVEAYKHSKGNANRITLIYKGLGSVTFQQKKGTSLLEPNEWRGKHKDRDFHVKLQFSNDRLTA